MVFVEFKIPQSVVLSQITNSSDTIKTVCITGDFDGWKHESYNMNLDQYGFYKIEISLPKGMKSSEFKILVNGERWLTLNQFPIVVKNGNCNNVLDVKITNAYYAVIRAFEPFALAKNEGNQQKVGNLVSPTDETMIDVALESAYSSDLVTDLDLQSITSGDKMRVIEKGKATVNNTVIDSSNAHFQEFDTIIAMDNGKKRKRKRKKNSAQSSSSSSSDDQYSVYRLEQLEITDHYIEGNNEAYANIMTDREYCATPPNDEANLNNSVFSNNTTLSNNINKNEYLIPRQIENGSSTSNSVVTLNNPQLLKSNSQSSLSHQATNKFNNVTSSSNKMKIKALMKSFFWKE